MRALFASVGNGYPNPSGLGWVIRSVIGKARPSLSKPRSSIPDAIVVERFTRIGLREILYEFSVEDPSVFTQVWRGEVPMLAADGQIYEYACHEGNYSLTGVLAGAREED